MKMLVVGDPHVKVEDLEDCRALLDLVAKTIQEERPEICIFMGDQFHHHSIMHLQCLKLWHDWLMDQAQSMAYHKTEIIMLVGNHDLAGNGDPECNSLVAISDCALVVARPCEIEGVLMVPYMDEKEFVKACIENPTKTVFCHQTFDGSRYENGFYAKDGVDANLIPQAQVVSGHIHSPQQVGKVQYVGAPRWQTISDAEVKERAIWVMQVEDGEIVEKRAVATNGVVRRIVHLVDQPDAPAIMPDEPNLDCTVDIKGPAGWIESRKPVWQGRAKIRTILQGRVARVKESDGIDLAFKKFLDGYRPAFGVEKEQLVNAIQTI